MANSGPNSNGCQVRPPVFLLYARADGGQFFITTAACDFLDNKHVVFGRVVDGMLTLRKIEAVSTGANNRPKLAVKIVGALPPPPSLHPWADATTQSVGRCSVVQ
jgi:peptidyl-prolyl isomerase H (cyclophilin H)